jgi:hypothetical protein
MKMASRAPLGWWRPTFVMGASAVFETPLGGCRLVIAQSVPDLLESEGYNVVADGHGSRLVHLVRALRHYVFYVAHYVGFKMRKPLKPFRIIDLRKVFERYEQRALEATDRCGGANGVVSRLQAKSSLGHGQSPVA